MRVEVRVGGRLWFIMCYDNPMTYEENNIRHNWSHNERRSFLYILIIVQPRNHLFVIHAKVFANINLLIKYFDKVDKEIIVNILNLIGYKFVQSVHNPY